MTDVLLVNFSQDLIIDEGGLLFPITTWLDDDGDECPREYATVAVAGEGERWYTFVLADFCPALT